MEGRQKERHAAELQQPGAVVLWPKHTSVAVFSTIAGITLTVGLPMLRYLALPMVALQNPAGI